MLKTLIFILCFIFSQWTLSQTETDIFLENVQNLRPTQNSVGMKIVMERAEKLKLLNREKRHEYLYANPVPVIVGPGGEYYIVDRHHLSAALIQSGHKKLYIRVINNWSDLDTETFWKRMSGEGFVYLYDSDMKKIKPSDLPDQVSKLKDNPFRSLAAYLRKLGAFEKTNKPFAEFFWVTFYKRHISAELLATNWAEAIEIGKRISHYKWAAAQPGFLPAKSCKALFLRK